MRMFEVPIQLEREEKIFGGNFSVRQMIFVIVGIGIGAVFFVRFFAKDLFAAVTIWSLFSAVGAFMAFFKKDDIEIDKYIVMYLKFLLSQKEYPFIGGENSAF
ncbi:MAG TPA: PrgI family protein [Thermoanaerobacter sp.]|nr:PrgI family protein [Thermoanaerobacter sp.]